MKRAAQSKQTEAAKRMLELRKGTQDLLDTPLSGSVFGDKDGEYSLAYNDLIGPMIKAIQELSTEVQSLKAQVSGSN